MYNSNVTTINTATANIISDNNTQLNNLIEIASNLVLSGVATIENAFEMAIKKDQEMISTAINDMEDMNRGYINKSNKTQKAFDVLLNEVYFKLS